jgi:nucleoside-diphosphate-sugar epimerase
VHAERAFWDFFNTTRDFDAVTINPAFILGPSASGKVDSVLGLLVPFLKPGVAEADLATTFQNIVDAGEIVAAIVDALMVPEAGGQRFVAADTLAYNDYAIAADAVHPSSAR